MIWIYRLQQRIGITRYEGIVLLVLILLFVVGLISRVVLTDARPLPPDAYAEADRRFQEAASQPVQVDAQVAETTPGGGFGPVNLNMASADELERLPHVGPKTAARILDYRARRGRFDRVEDLMRVHGIGPKTFARLEPLVVVE